jgi:iron complex transport system ATP-binding protein
MSSIEIKNLTIKRKDFELLCPKLTIKENEKVAILGENGSGKTTLLLALTGNIEKFSGSIELFGKPILSYRESKRAKLVSFLPQFSDMLFNNSVFDVVLLGRYAQNGGVFTKQDIEKTKSILYGFDLLKFKDKGYYELSGGEKRRVMVAKTINQDALIDVFDEPFANMDIKHSIKILKMIQKRQKTTIASLHDINFALAFFDRIIALKGGKIIFDGAKDEITKEVVDEVYEINSRIVDNRFIFV